MADNNLVWADLEMTGLDPDTDQIIEIATIITDKDLNVIAEGPELIIHCQEDRLQKMDDWNTNQHRKSGLWDACIESKVLVSDAETATLEFIKDHVPQGKSPLCGNSIWQDRRFIAKWMGRIDQYLHYRTIDVSTIKELNRLWYPSIPSFEKKGLHRAKDDILQSIDELRYYQKNLFTENHS